MFLGFQVTLPPPKSHFTILHNPKRSMMMSFTFLEIRTDLVSQSGRRTRFGIINDGKNIVNKGSWYGSVTTLAVQGMMGSTQPLPVFDNNDASLTKAGAVTIERPNTNMRDGGVVGKGRGNGKGSGSGHKGSGGGGKGNSSGNGDMDGWDMWWLWWQQRSFYGIIIGIASSLINMICDLSNEMRRKVLEAIAKGLVKPMVLPMLKLMVLATTLPAVIVAAAAPEIAVESPEAGLTLDTAIVLAVAMTIVQLYLPILLVVFAIALLCRLFEHLNSRMATRMTMVDY